MIIALSLLVALSAEPSFAQAPFATMPQTAAPAPTEDEAASPKTIPADAEAAAPAPTASTAEPSSAALAAKEESAPAVTEVPSAAQSWDKRWSMMQSAAKNSDYSGAEAEIVDDLNVLISQNPEAPDAAQARFLAASLEDKEGLHDRAMVDLLHLLYEFPNTDISLQAQSLFQDIANRRLPSRFRFAISSVAQAGAHSTAPDRLAALIQLLVEDFGKQLYAATQTEIRAFMIRFPSYAGMDQIQWNLTRLHESDDNNRAALLDAQELLALYPKSPLAEKAKFEAGALYSNLGLYEKSVGAYQSFAAAYPQSPNAVAALVQIAEIFADHLSQYDMAIKTDEMILAEVPQGQNAAQALYQETSLYDCSVLFVSCKLNNPAKALTVYQRIVDSGNMNYLDKKQAERVRSRINDLNKKLAKTQAAQAAASQAVAPASQEAQ